MFPGCHPVPFLDVVPIYFVGTATPCLGTYRTGRPNSGFRVPCCRAWMCLCWSLEPCLVFLFQSLESSFGWIISIVNGVSCSLGRSFEIASYMHGSVLMTDEVGYRC